MKKFVILVALLALAAPASAITILPNVRPVTVNVTGEPSLQYLVNGPTNPLAVFDGDVLDVNTDQSTAAFFKPSSRFGTSTPTMWFEWTAGLNGTFGLYSLQGETINYLPVFFGDAVGYTQYPGIINNSATGASLHFNLDGTINIEGNCGTKINCVQNSNIINSQNFGFYLLTGGRYFYTLDSLNSDGKAHVLAFQRPGASTEWLFAFEDGSDNDFQDVGVKVESISAVPEPGSMLLLGSGLIGLAGAARRRFAKK